MTVPPGADFYNYSIGNGHRIRQHFAYVLSRPTRTSNQPTNRPGKSYDAWCKLSPTVLETGSESVQF